VIARAVHLLVGAGLVLGGAAIGRATAPHDAPTATSMASPPPRVATTPCVARLGDDDLRRIRDALPTPASTMPPPSPPRAAPEPATPTAAQVAAAGDAERILDAGLAAGRWTDADATRLRASLAPIDAGARVALMQRLAVAINSGQVTLETSGSPF